MFRLLVRLLIFAVVISLSLYVGVQWKLKQDLEQIDKQLGSAIKFSYETSAITLTGQVVVGGVELRFIHPKIDVSVNKVKLSTGSIFDMAFLSSLFREKTLPENFSLILDQVVIPLTPDLVKLITAVEQPDSWSRMAAVGCGEVRSIGMSQYFAMGYDYLVFSSETRYSRDSFNGHLIGSSRFSIEETADVVLKFDIANFFESLDTRSARPIEPSIESMTIDILDRGYNRHRNEYCAIKSEQKIEEYLGNHVIAVKQKFAQADINITPTGIRFYTEYLQPSSRLNINITPKPSFSLADFGFYNESEIRDILGLDLKLNGKNIGLLFKDWSHDKFAQIAFTDSSSSQSDQETKRFETVVVRRTFETAPISSIRTQVGAQARLTQYDGKEFLGKIIKIEDQRVFLATPRDGGTVQRSLPLSQVKKLEILTRTP